MDQNTLEKAKIIFQKVADEMGLTLVSTRFYQSKEDGPVLEVLIDHDFQITMEEIQNFTDKVNPLIDEIDSSEEGYLLDISSGGSERVIPFQTLDKFIGQWLDVKLKKNGDVVSMMLDDVKDGKASFHYFQKGKKTKLVLNEDDVDTIHMGYKA